MIPPLQQAALVREYHQELQARADHARLVKEAKAARGPQPSWVTRGWSSLLWFGHFFLQRHTEHDTVPAQRQPLAGSAH